MVQGVKSSKVIAGSGLVLQEQIRLREAQGLVRSQRHPFLPLTIYNYTEKCQYEKAWDEITLQCRGLVLHDNGSVAARPFQKFFNDTEHDQADIPWHLRHEVIEKIDGSLLILFHACDQWVFSTRGSFTSEQAIRGEEIFYERYGSPDDCDIDTDMTYLFEVIYPENRIVVDYGNARDVILLGVIQTETGAEYSLSAQGDRFSVAKMLPVSLDENHGLGVLRGFISDNQEGYVVRFSNGFRVKVKGENYIRLHSALSGLSTRKVWECLRDNGNVEPLLGILPDETHGWVIETANKISERFMQIRRRVELAVDSVKNLATRKEMAVWILANAADIRGACFSALDGEDCSRAIWRMVEPEFQRPTIGPLRDVGVGASRSIGGDCNGN